LNYILALVRVKLVENWWVGYGSENDVPFQENRIPLINSRYILEEMCTFSANMMLKKNGFPD
jgi:hypothetical protein